MDIFFKRKKDRQTANSQDKLEKKFRGNPRRAKLVRARLDDLADADNLAVLRDLPQAACHELRGKRSGQLAVKLDKGFRMLFEVANDPVPRKSDGGLDWTRVTAIRVLELSKDYHE